MDTRKVMFRVRARKQQEHYGAVGPQERRPDDTSGLVFHGYEQREALNESISRTLEQLWDYCEGFPPNILVVASTSQEETDQFVRELSDQISDKRARIWLLGGSDTLRSLGVGLEEIAVISESDWAAQNIEFDASFIPRRYPSAENPGIARIAGCARIKDMF